MARTYGNPFDKFKSTKIPEIVKYVEKNYKDKIPKKYNGNVERFMYDYRNGPGKCVICGEHTEWDDKKKKYKSLCEPLSVKRLFKDPLRTIKTYINNKGNSCSEVVRKKFVENSVKKVGTANFMELEGFQQKLLANRKISRIVSFKGKEFTVVGSYEERFLKVLSPLVLSANEVEAPGIEIKWKDDQGRERLHISDFFLPKYNCVISIKDGGSNKNNHPSMTDRRKNDAYKFKALVDKTKYNVIELNGLEEINEFPKILKQLKDSIKQGKRFIIYPEYYHEYVK